MVVEVVALSSGDTSEEHEGKGCVSEPGVNEALRGRPFR